MIWFKKISRRTFGQLSAFFTFVSLALKEKILNASDNSCELSKTKSVVSWDAQYDLIHWVDGFKLDKGDLKYRASLAILLKFEQTELSYVDKVIFTSSSKKILAGFYFEASDKISGGYPPYIILDNIDLSSSSYFLYIQVQEQNSRKVYRSSFSGNKIKRSALTGKHLPAVLKADLSSVGYGVVSSIFSFKREIDSRDHTFSAMLLSIGSEGEFSIKISFMHKDEEQFHYMRYFIVTDPVGRILAIHRREFGDGIVGSIIMGQLTETQRNQWGILKENVGRISDCPYIMVFQEDVKESLSKVIIWLR